MSKKLISSGASMSTSASPPSGQRSIQTMLKQDKEKEQERASFQMIMQGIQDLKVKIDTIEQRTGRTEEKVESIQQMMTKYEERLQKVEEGGKRREEKIGNIGNRLTVMEQEKSGMLKWELDRSEFYLRFQNIEEEKGQDLAAIMVGILADALEITEEKMMDGIDEIYRVFTRYAMRNNLPREVHIRFTKKSMKTQILQVAREKILKYKGKEILGQKKRSRWTLNNTILKEKEFTQWMEKELAFFFKENRKEDTSIQNVWDTMKAYARGLIIDYTRKKNIRKRQAFKALEDEYKRLEKELQSQGPLSSSVGMA
uniref:L1 transposable element RRM domain-containing protein n=1 Tax=Pseudonaja textilis TaxID=8673 RepID=A0A670ZWJ4_PSETE